MSNIDNAKWYVIRTFSAYEAFVQKNIEKMVENNALQDFIFDVCVPTEQAIVQTEFRMTPLTGTMKSVSVRTGSIMKSMMEKEICIYSRVAGSESLAWIRDSILVIR